jgi:hypothetical protein
MVQQTGRYCRSHHFIIKLFIQLHESDEIGPTMTCENHEYTVRLSQVHHRDIIGVHERSYHGELCGVSVFNLTMESTGCSGR